MRKSVLTITAVMLVLVWANVAFGFDPMGPPKAGLSEGQFGWRAEYLYGRTDMEVGGAFGLPGTDIDAVEMDKIYANFGYGLTDNWEIFLRLGGTRVDVDSGANTDNLGFFIGDSNLAFSIGGGTKVTFLEEGSISLGLLAQVSLTDISDFNGNTGAPLGVPASFSSEMRLTEVQIAVGPTWEVVEGVSVYGGPFVHFIDGEADLTGTISGSPAAATMDIGEAGVFGGYIGTSIRLFKVPNTIFNIEFQGTGAGYAAAVQLAVGF